MNVPLHIPVKSLRAFAVAGALLAASCLPKPPEDQPDPNTSMLLRWTGTRG
jgi:hypothetical protein